MGLTVWLAKVSEAQMSGQAFKPDSEFDLRAFAERSFGACKEPPLDIVLRFTPAIRFSPLRTVVQRKDHGIVKIGPNAITATGLVGL